MSRRVPDARRRRLHARGNRCGTRRHSRNEQGPTLSRPRKAAGGAGRICGGMEVMSDDKNLSLNGYDFGDDADIELPNDPDFDAWINSAAPSINTPNAAPRAEM